MPITVTCQTCGKVLKAPDGAAGKKVRCPGCETVFVLPSPPESNGSSSASPATSTPSTPRKSASADPPRAGVSSQATGASLRPTTGGPARPATTSAGPANPPTAKPRASKPQHAEANEFSSDGPPDDDSAPQEPDPWDVGDDSNLESLKPLKKVRRKKSPSNSILQTGPRPSDDEEEDHDGTSDEDDGLFESSPKRRPKKTARGRKGLATGAITPYRRYAHWLLALTLLPLFSHTLFPGESNRQRIIDTMKDPEFEAKADAVESREELFDLLPDNRFPGAHLPYRTATHWLYAGMSVLLFIGMIALIHQDSESEPFTLFGIGCLTGTVGIFLLLAFQFVAAVTQDIDVRGRGVVVGLFYVIKFIGFSYRMATDADYGFFLSFVGFTMGVGLCEELCKGIPVLAYMRAKENATWKLGLVVGLASGAGFGISEGIHYSGGMYNGVSTGSIYVVRFVSCVGLHAIWAGAVGILVSRTQEHLDDGFGTVLLNMIGFNLPISMVLHGLYDTFLKVEQPFLALVTAGVSLVWLGWLVQQQIAFEEGDDDDALGAASQSWKKLLKKQAWIVPTFWVMLALTLMGIFFIFSGDPKDLPQRAVAVVGALAFAVLVTVVVAGGYAWEYVWQRFFPPDNRPRRPRTAIEKLIRYGMIFLIALMVLFPIAIVIGIMIASKR